MRIFPSLRAWLLYVITWFGRAVITSEHLSATTFWGRRRELPWPSIGKVTAMRLAGIPFLFVRSPQANVFVYLLGVDRDRIRARLSEVAGTQHPVTVAVSPGAAS